MARYSGEVGFGFSEQNPPESDKWVDVIKTETMKGDIVRNNLQSGVDDSVLPEIKISHSISVVASTFAFKNCSKIRYAMWMGQRWTVTGVEVRRPRLILTLGEVYNGPTP